MARSTTTAVDVVVVGAGYSGLAAGLYAQGAGATVVVLEARARVGGRICNDVAGTGAKVDMGGAYVGPTQDRLLRMAERFGVETFPVPTAGKTVCMIGGKRRVHSGTIPPLNPLALLDVNNTFRATYTLIDKIEAEAPWNAPQFAQWDQQTVHEWLNGMCWTSAARELFRVGVRSVLGAEPCEVSMAYFLWYLKSAGGLYRLIDNENGAQERKFKGGAVSICEAMARELGRSVVLSAPVTVIDRSDPAHVRVTVADGREFIAPRVILGLAPSLYGKIRFVPSLSGARMQLCNRLVLGPYMKTVTYYRTPFWRTQGFSGIALCEGGPVLFTMDDTKPDGSHPAIMGFVLTGDAAEHSRLPEQERRRRVCEQYARVWNCEEALHPIAYIDKSWVDEEYSWGGVPYMPPGTTANLAPLLRQPEDRLHFAGTETATRWMGYMDGAIQAGERAAHEVLVALGSTRRHIRVPAAAPGVEPPSRTVIARPSGLKPEEKWLPSVGTVLAVLVLVLSIAVVVLMR